MLRRSLAAVLLLVLGAAAGLALHLATARGDTMFAGKRPGYLGVKDGRLARPKSTPNCVASQADAADGEHYVAPIRFKGSALEAIAAARKAVESMARATVVRHEGNYLYAEFKSRLMGFVDDVEFTYDEKAGVLHLRSASRLGRRDFGVNRARAEALRARIEGRINT
ncbi:MAG TPA: DUF1499 domain-containing protein [Burkholderiales bacterium]|nr:DUF1499 domain-containing protein [Burkholderiales bacterium]